MLRKRMMILAILIVSLLSISVVSAADNVSCDIVGAETQNNDIVSYDVLKTAPKTFADLNATINGNTNKHVYLDGNYTFSEDSDSGFKEGINVSRAVTIHGNGFTIDGANNARVFNVYANKIIFQDIIFVNCNSSGSGGAISGNYNTKWRCTTVNCSFINCSAARSGGAVNAFRFTAVNCSFVNNSASGGGAIDGPCSVENCSFIGNSAESGGAIHGFFGCVARNCIFENNTVKYNPDTSIITENGTGGAICGNCTSINCTFIGNRALRGGALYGYSYGYYMKAVNCTFINNYASEYGGAMYSDSDSDALYCTFIGNSAKNAGATCYIFNVNCSFINNSATEYGGAVYGYISVDCLFSQNTAGLGGDDTYNAKNTLSTYLYAPNATRVVMTNGKVFVTLKDVHGNPASGVNLLMRISLKNYTRITNASGQAVFSVSGYGPGTVTATISSETSDNYYKASPINITITTIKMDSVLTLPGDVFICNTTGSIVATLKRITNRPIIYANVKITVGSLAQTLKTDLNGQAALNISGLSEGVYTVFVKSASGADFNSATPINATVYVCDGKVNTTLAVPDVVTVNGHGSVGATLKDIYGNAIKGVNVKITVGSLAKTLKTDDEGYVSLDISSLDPGNYTVSVKSATTDIYNRATETASAFVSADKINTVLTAPDVVTFCGSGSVVATLSDVYGNAIKGVNVKISVGNLAKTMKTDANGQVALDISALDMGNYTAAIKSATTELYAWAPHIKSKVFVIGDTLNTTLDVPNVVTLTDIGGNVVATLKDSYGNPASGVNVKITVGSLAKTLKTDARGQVALDIGSLDPGSYTVSVKSATTELYNRATATAMLVISQEKVNTALTVPDVTIIQGSGDKIVATFKDVYGNAIKGVNVKITVGSIAKTLKTNANGQVAWDVSSLEAGNYTASFKTATTDVYNRATATAKVTVMQE